MKPFLQSNLGWIVTSLGLIVSFIYSQGMASQRFSEMTAKIALITDRINKYEGYGSEYARHNRFMIEQGEKELEKMKVEVKAVAVAQTLFASDLRLIAEWVRRQEAREDRQYKP